MKKIILNLVEKYRRHFFTFHERPFRVEQTRPIPDPTGDCAIIIQGPTTAFTLETVRFYQKNYPEARVIVSTWEGQNTEHFRCEVVKDTLPLNRGPRNINCQIISTRNALARITETYTLKTRGDQRMYGVNCLRFMKNLLEHFGDRLIGNDFGTHLDSEFFFSDMFLFGKTEDIKTYAAAPLVTQERVEEHLAFFNKPAGQEFLSERYLFKAYLMKKGWKPEMTMENYYKALALHAVSVDNDSLDIYWPKYRRWEEHRHRSYTHYGHTLSFKEWLHIFTTHSEQESQTTDTAHDKK